MLEAYRAILRARPHHLVMSMPGRSTPWSGIVHLTANVVLNIETRNLRRIFPRRESQPTTPSEAAADIAPRLRGQANALVASGRPVAISMTAGVDSRVSVAASRDARAAVRYFTYRRPDLEKDNEDVSVAQSIAESVGLRHEVLDVIPSDLSPELDASIREATFLAHGRAIVAAYRRAFSPETTHIRSNIGEIGRSFYRRTNTGAAMPASAARISALDLAMLWGHGYVSEPVVAAFDDWMVATRFGDVAGLDPLDVLYWEHRMSCWHASVVLESDFAFETHVLFNSRWILERMLAVPVRDRLRDVLFERLVSTMWPELRRWPMHHEERTWRSFANTLRRRARGSGAPAEPKWLT
jgi:hypothetical protein